MWIWPVICYFLGGINGAYIVTRWFLQADIRTIGSKNGGARNAGRVGGRGAFVWTVVMDALKTILPLMIGVRYQFPSIIIAGMILALIIGHIWPIMLKWSGGKGVVTFLACVLVLDLMSLLIIGGAAIITKLLPISFSKWMLLAMTTPFVITFIKGDLILSLAFALGYLLVITAHVAPVHPTFRPKEEHL